MWIKLCPCVSTECHLCIVLWFFPKGSCCMYNSHSTLLCGVLPEQIAHICLWRIVNQDRNTTWTVAQLCPRCVIQWNINPEKWYMEPEKPFLWSNRFGEMLHFLFSSWQLTKHIYILIALRSLARVTPIQFWFTSISHLSFILNHVVFLLSPHPKEHLSLDQTLAFSMHT